MPLANYTTSVPVSRTMNEISEMLAKAGARSVMIDYGEFGVPTAISFRITSVDIHGDTHLHFRLPADYRAVQAVLKKQRLACDNARSQRVSWRIVRDWLRAQLALTEAGQAKLDQVMLPYLIIPATNETLYEKLSMERFGIARLPAPEKV